MNRRESGHTDDAAPVPSIPDGPWCAATWHVVEPRWRPPPPRQRHRPVHRQRLCRRTILARRTHHRGHHTASRAVLRPLLPMWFRAGQPVDFTAWAARRQTGRPALWPPPAASPSTSGYYRPPRPTRSDSSSPPRSAAATGPQRQPAPIPDRARRHRAHAHQHVFDRTHRRRLGSAVPPDLAAHRLLRHSLRTVCAASSGSCTAPPTPTPGTRDHWHWRDGFEFVLDDTHRDPPTPPSIGPPSPFPGSAPPSKTSLAVNSPPPTCPGAR